MHRPNQPLVTHCRLGVNSALSSAQIGRKCADVNIFLYQDLVRFLLPTAQVRTCPTVQE